MVNQHLGEWHSSGGFPRTEWKFRRCENQERRVSVHAWRVIRFKWRFFLLQFHFFVTSNLAFFPYFLTMAWSRPEDNSTSQLLPDLSGNICHDLVSGCHPHPVSGYNWLLGHSLHTELIKILKSFKIQPLKRQSRIEPSTHLPLQPSNAGL